MRTRRRRWIPPPGDRVTGFGVPCCGGSSVSRGEPGLQRGPRHRARRSQQVPELRGVYRGNAPGGVPGLRHGPAGSRRAPLRAEPVLPRGGGIAPAWAAAGGRTDPARKAKS